MTGFLPRGEETLKCELQIIDGVKNILTIAQDGAWCKSPFIAIEMHNSLILAVYSNQFLN